MSSRKLVPTKLVRCKIHYVVEGGGVIPKSKSTLMSVVVEKKRETFQKSEAFREDFG